MPGHTAEAGFHGQKPPVTQHGLTGCGFGHDDLLIRLRLAAGDKLFHTTASGAFLIYPVFLGVYLSRRKIEEEITAPVQGTNPT